MDLTETKQPRCYRNSSQSQKHILNANRRDSSTNSHTCSLQKHLLSIHTHCSSSNELAVFEMVTNSLYWVKVRKIITLVTLFLFLLATFAFFHRNTFHKCKILIELWNNKSNPFSVWLLLITKRMQNTILKESLDYVSG